MKINDKVNKVVKNVFPNCNVIAIEPIEKGFMNKKHIVKISNPEKELVLKVGENRRLEDSKLLSEAGILKLVKERIPGMPVPEIFLANEPDDVFDCPYVLMSKLPGEDLSDVWDKLAQEEKEEIIYQMGHYLAKLHTIKFDKFGDIKKDCTLIKTSSTWDKKAIPELFKELGKQEIYGIHSEEFRDEIIMFVRKNIPFFAEQKDPTLVHNDWHKDHFRIEKVNDKWNVVGILDFEFGEAAPKLYDFVKSERWLFRDEPFTKKPFLQGYRDAGGELPDNYDQVMKVFRAHHKIYFIRRLFEDKKYQKDVEEYTRRLKELIR